MPIPVLPEAGIPAVPTLPAGPSMAQGHPRSANNGRSAAAVGGTTRMGRVRRAIYATALFVALALVGMRSAFLYFEYGQAVARAEEATRDMARIVEEYTRRIFETDDLIVREITGELERRGGLAAMGPLEVHRLLVDYAGRTPVGDYLIVVDTNGRVFAQSTGYPATPVDLSDRPWFRAHLGGADRFIGEALFSRLSREIVFTYSRRIEGPTDRFEGVVQAAIRPAVLRHLTEVGSLGGDVVLRITTAQGKLLAHSNMRNVRAETVAEELAAMALPAAADGGSVRLAGTYRGTGADGVERILSFRRLGDWPVVVEAGLPVAAAMAPVREGLL
ncbi:MAG TPA: cache domain-containing protein, partial [Azospirillaceae bacterium]|nr:cache domain-containing protein [Azospirillaceae bacterium]